MTTDETRDGLYTEEQWKTILSTLPRKADKEKFRRQILVRALCLKLQTYAMPPQFEKDLRRIASAARCFRIDVHDIRSSNNIDVERDAYLRDLLQLWTSAGGKLGTSNPPPGTPKGDRKPGGPLIRYLMAVAGPPLSASGRNLTEHAVQAFVKKTRSDMVS